MFNLPNFQINPENINADLTTLLQAQREKIAEISHIAQPTWNNFIEPLTELSDQLHHFWSPINHLHSVNNTPALREAYAVALAQLTEYHTDLGQNAALFNNYQRLQSGKEYSQLNTTQQRVIVLALRDFHLSGVALNAADKAEYKKIVTRLAELSTQFENNLIDATQAWSKHINDSDQLCGLSAPRLQAMQAAAQAKNLSGYLVTLDYPCYYDVITFADNRALREEIYQAYVTRASDQGSHAGQHDNSAIIQEILLLREQLAKLLGFENYAAMSLVPKMANSVTQVEQFLTQLINKVKPKAQQDLAELQKIFPATAPWDIAYYSEKLRQKNYLISQEEIKMYFPSEHVLTGLFNIIEKLYGITLQKKAVPSTWHPDVQFFELLDQQQQCIGGIYLDLYARENKRQGAWMDDAVSRRRLTDGEIQLPIAFLTCNFSPATQQTPALLTHDEVETLFHEMGHCLQHVLTQVDYPAVAGINNVPWDAVEFPSQFFEAWAWQPESLSLLSRHYQTGEPLPDKLIQKMLAAKNFQAGLFLIRQLEFALFDLRLHTQHCTDVNFVTTTLNHIRTQVAVIKAPAYNRFAHGFSHIFAGGYAAGYYSYLWAEVLARDAFSLFQTQGLFDQKLGKRFKDTVLGLGGSEAPEIIFEKFMGRAPDDDALLRSYGF